MNDRKAQQKVTLDSILLLTEQCFDPICAVYIYFRHYNVILEAIDELNI